MGEGREVTRKREREPKHVREKYRKGARSDEKERLR